MLKDLLSHVEMNELDINELDINELETFIKIIGLKSLSF